jgi:hypothetical protein
LNLSARSSVRQLKVVEADALIDRMLDPGASHAFGLRYMTDAQPGI